MGNHGKLEALITVPTGGWTIEFTHSVEGAKDVTFAAGETYYWSSLGDQAADLPLTLKTKLDAAFSGGTAPTFSIGEGFGEDESGLISITASAGTIEVTSITASADTLLGGIDAAAAGATIISPNHVKSLWLAPTASNSPYGVLDPGWDEADYATTKAPDGTVVATRYNRYVANRIEWQNCPRNKVRTAYESTTNESFQTFYRDAILGEHAAMNPGGPVRWHPDADDPATFFEYKVVTPGPTFQPQRVVETWTGLYPVVLDRLIQVPA